MARSCIGRVTGDSFFEEWSKKNPGKTWDDLMTSLKGPGISSFRYKETNSNGNYIYEIILENGVVAGETVFPLGPSGADFLTLEFVRFDDEGNTIVRSKNSKGQYGDEITIKRGKRGYTGGIVGLPDGEPLPPTTDRYGTIIEYQGSEIPEGWALCNGGTLEARKYPHLIGRLPSVCEPIEARFKFIDRNTASYSSVSGSRYRRISQMICGGESFETYFYDPRSSFYSINKNGVYSEYTCFSEGNEYYYATIPDKSPKEVSGFISTLRPTNSKIYMYPKAIAFDGKNFEYGGIIPKASGGTTRYNKNLHPDIYFNIEYIDEDSGDWRLGVQLHNKTDFIKSTILDNMYIAEIKTTFKTKKIRLSIDPKSTPHYPNSSVDEDFYFLGRFQMYIDDIPNRDMTVLKLPNLKDTSGRYKLVYIGQPLEITEPTMYSYSKDNIFNGEVPLSLAVNNELPNYTEGITMTEPQPSRIGYTNKYNNDTDTWELVKTHLDKEGYYYDENGDLKYIYKPHNWFKWDFETHTWIEDTLLKEEAKNELLNKYIELELKKDKIIQLKLNTEDIEKQIKIVKQELEVFDA